MRWITLTLALAFAVHAPANPAGLTVRSGSATAQSSGSQMTVTTGSLALLNWSSFNIRSGETTTFVQPSANSVVFNVIRGANASQIYGNLNANGTVILANSHGFYFGPNSFVNVGGNFIATTAPLPADPGSGASWSFTGTPPLASIVNYGQISAGQGHSLYLIAEDVENHGNLAAPGGNVGLCAGQDVLLTEQADGRGLSATVKLPAGSVDNSGRIIADAGTIALNAQVVNQNGVLQADSVREQNGTVELVASGQLNLGPNSQILARGDGSPSGSSGGSVTLKAGNSFADSFGSQIIITGGAQGGNGGTVEISAPNILSLNASIDASAQPGSVGGQLFLDPVNITLNASGSGTVPSSGTSGTVAYGTAGNLSLNVTGTAPSGVFNGLSAITLQATGNITLNTATTWNLSRSTGETSGTLTLQAGGNIYFDNNSGILDANNWSVSLQAGMTFPGHTVPAGGGNIYLNGSSTGTIGGSIQTSAGSITINALDSIAIGSGTVGSTGGGPITLNAGAGISFGSGTVASTGGSVLLQSTSQNIALGPTPWSLSDSVTPAAVTLQAADNITIASGGGITAGKNWSLILVAGANDFTSPPTVSSPPSSRIVASGTGSVTLAGTAYLQTENGNIDISAGNSVTVGNGNICTVGLPVASGSYVDGETGGGSINVLAVAGSINAGTDNGVGMGGYSYSPLGSGYSVAINTTATGPGGLYTPSPGGISTAGGGNVWLEAGQDIISQPSTLPGLSIGNTIINGLLGYAPGATGAYGSQPGNVTLIAGNQIIGNFTLANGVGTILSGVGNTTPSIGSAPQIQNADAEVGNSTSPVTLGLIAGAWNVWSGGGIFIQNVLNPNGTFNYNSLKVPAGEYVGDVGDSTVPVKTTFLYDYAPNAAANFWAGNSITLSGQNLPYVNGYQTTAPIIYPPILSLSAGAGGITVGNSIVLDPSSQGALQITTSSGGDLAGVFQLGNLPTGITMSGSGLPGYAGFGFGFASTPLHLNDPNPVVVDISGGINSFSLSVPTFAQIAVAGSTYNFDFSGQNLSSSQTTAIIVAGDITYRGDTTSVPLATPLPAALFNPTLTPLNGQQALEDLQYNAATALLSFNGAMTSADETYLFNPTVLVLNSSGRPEVCVNGQPITKPLTLTAAQQAAIEQLFVASQDATLGAGGLVVAGPGHFAVTAADINLGVSAGIQVSEGNSAVTAISPYGADLTVRTSGFLDMTSSQIANRGLLGSVDLNIGSTLDVGNQFTPFGSANATTGILTTSGGGISITAAGDVDVDGSRVTAYDGGNIKILSTTGNVDAGIGGTGDVNVEGEYINSKTGQLITFDDSIPGSGVMATALPHSPAPLGNIVIDTPEGSINASKGGILQLALNGANTQNSSITLNAGRDIVATGSGVIGANLQLTAGGSINGILVSSGVITVEAAVNANVTAFAKGDVSISAGGDVSGTVMTSGSASVSGESITASLISQSVTTSGSTTGSAIGVPQSNVPKEDSKVADDASTMAALANQTDTDDDKKKKDKSIALAQKSGHVTVILPGKNNTPHL